MRFLLFRFIPTTSTLDRGQGDDAGYASSLCSSASFHERYQVGILGGVTLGVFEFHDVPVYSIDSVNFELGERGSAGCI